ncbi:Gfo/Idh/MocA family protein [Halobacillus massiliensis]|uniref:Gfo/Idh/MocA family protein n=1 Tax=Halobacillus massiliensis TaxID=1926286 RepID=UPI0009E4F0D7|nr:Gfo/Idh/MocA family oxidoreductase [Halobacillus massiliensis]
MVRFGTIGTNFITKHMIEAGRHLDNFELKGVYSRTSEKAEEFASEYGASLTFTAIDELVDSEEIDAVYVASPNSFHVKHAISAMSKGKHVLCEKPLASNEQEADQMVTAARENGVVFMEAVKSTLMPGFLRIKENLHKIGEVRRYVGNFCKYSSRYDAYREGTVLNAFNPEFSNGSLMDLGVYGIYPMVVLFGKPEKILANGVKLESGVDGAGSLLAAYPNMEAVIIHSKINHSHSPSEIQGEEGVIIIPNISEPAGVYIRYNDGTTENLDNENDFPPMYYEIEEFIQLIENGEKQSEINSHEASLITSHILEQARKQMGIVYPADK